MMTIRQMASVETAGRNVVARSVARGHSRFTNRPRMMGRITTQRMLSSIPTTLTSTVSPTSSNTSNGVSSGASSVDVAVIPTESARSPFAR